MILKKDFFEHHAKTVARELIGKVLLINSNGKILSGIINETEAYHGFTDDACHGHKGETERCKSLFKDGGHVYVYFTYGIHHMLNIVTFDRGTPSAVLIRSIIPKTGKNELATNRFNKNYKDLSSNQLKTLTNGPGKLTQAFKIDRSFDGVELNKKNKIWIEDQNIKIDKEKILLTPRIGIDYAEKSKNWDWRFYLDPKAL